MSAPLVVIESPFRHPDPAEHAANVGYAIRAMRDSIGRGEAPIASHLLYTQCLDDMVPAERALGIGLGLEWARVADFVAVYTDRGISEGMGAAIAKHLADGRQVVYRSLRKAEAP